MVKVVRINKQEFTNNRVLASDAYTGRGKVSAMLASQNKNHHSHSNHFGTSQMNDSKSKYSVLDGSKLAYSVATDPLCQVI